MISTRNALVGAAVSALAMFAVAVPASAATASPACTKASDNLAKAKTDLATAQSQYRSDKAAGAPTDTLDRDVANVSTAQTAKDLSQNAADAQCRTTPIINPGPVLRPRPGPQPIVTVGGNYPIPTDQAQREHLVQVCINNNRGLGLTVGALTKDCRDTVPPCPATPCDNCTPTPTDTPAPPVVAGPTTIIEQPAPTYVAPAPSGGEIVQAPSGAPSTGSVDPADRYIGG